MAANRARVVGGELSSTAPPRPRLAPITPTTTAPTPWRRSVPLENTCAPGAVDALARRVGQTDVTHITGIVLPQVETTTVASR